MRRVLRLFIDVRRTRSLNAERNANLDTILESAAFAGFLVAQFLAVVVTHAARFDDVSKESRHTIPQTGGLRDNIECGPNYVFEEDGFDQSGLRSSG